MTATVYIPLWVPAAAICLLCLLPDFGGMVKRLIERWRDRRLLDTLWRDNDGGGWPSSGRSEPFVATTVRRTPAATTPQDAA